MLREHLHTRRIRFTDYLQVDPIKGGPSGGHDSKPNEIPAGHVRALEAIV